MDYSKNIKINDYNDEKKKNNNKDFLEINNSYNDFSNFNKNNINNSNEHDLTKNNRKYKKTIINNEEKEIKDREVYKKLFQISEYLYYYKNKKEINYINLNDNIKNNNDNISKKIRNRKNSIKINSNSNKNVRRGDNNISNSDNKNISINMFNKKNISYLWYMEAKNKNKIFNYKISNNYEELFTD